jgi:hypothetical protein
VRDGAAASVGRETRIRRRVTMMQEYWEREKTRFNVDLSCFRTAGL